MREHLAYQPVGAKEVDVELVPDRLRRDVLDGTELAVAGVVHQTVDAPLGVDEVLDDAFALAGVCHVELGGHASVGQVRQVRFVACGRPDRPVVGQEGLGSRSPDSGGRARYQHRLRHVSSGRTHPGQLYVVRTVSRTRR